jgi:hypothetical protein
LVFPENISSFKVDSHLELGLDKSLLWYICLAYEVIYININNVKHWNILLKRQIWATAEILPQCNIPHWVSFKNWIHMTPPILRTTKNIFGPQGKKNLAPPPPILQIK